MIETAIWAFVGGVCFVFGAWFGRRLTLSEWRVGALSLDQSLAASCERQLDEICEIAENAWGTTGETAALERIKRIASE
jgi:hypothetical protein